MSPPGSLQEPQVGGMDPLLCWSYILCLIICVNFYLKGRKGERREKENEREFIPQMPATSGAGVGRSQEHNYLNRYPLPPGMWTRCSHMRCGFPILCLGYCVIRLAPLHHLSSEPFLNHPFQMLSWTVAWSPFSLCCPALSDTDIDE